MGRTMGPQRQCGGYLGGKLCYFVVYEQNSAQIKKFGRRPLAHFETTFTGFEGKGGPGVTSLFEPKIYYEC